jgi:2,5-diketo-D-gluconate reductase A
MPRVGLGSYNIHEPDEIYRAVKDIGYRMIDTASFYKNEECVGKAIAQLIEDKVVERKDLYVLSKVWHDEVEDVQAACKRSL